MTKFMCKNTLPLLNIPGSGLDMPALRSRQQKDKVVVVMGATGTGKSRLSIDLATHFPAEVVNSDKMQVYQGLDIVTNKISDKERRGVPHHLLGITDPNTDFTVTNFCDSASLAIKSILHRRKLPVIAGGSNSFIEALIDDPDYEFMSRYDCIFLWVDVAVPVLDPMLSDRVDKLIEIGMIGEVKEIFDPLNCDYSKGYRRAIGVPELDHYFRAKCDRERILREAIEEIKVNTCKLARRQLGKINRLRSVKGWKLQRIDATKVFTKSGGEAEEKWEEMVVEPSVAIVSRFLNNFGRKNMVVNRRRGGAMEMALAAVSY
ncbi:hypothetical protein LguiB_000235 [Lonicera macranthoides]